ncbi:MAG TPA: hypothetical protein DIU15_19090 [Deltaproteobacteria bacterium]|nr:hypothetical protein [Deltaproteobacteria bacterium]HCP48152.1 hypothetical protein [Deltaproteobacteria bacterium]
MLDGSLILGLAVASVAWRLQCAPWGDVFGDAYMALECAYHFVHGDLTIRPSQPIYGHGLCMAYAPLFLGADNLWDVAVRRSVVGALVVPLWFCLARLSAVRLYGASAQVGRAAGLTLALAALRNDTLAQMGNTGTLGYFAPPLILVLFLCWVRALTQRAPGALLVSFAMVPVILSNHPFTLWLIPASLLLLPAFARANGWLATGAACVAAGVTSMPRLSSLRRLTEGAPLSEGIRQIADPGSTPGDMWQRLQTGLSEPENAILVAGVFVLILAPWFAPRVGAGPETEAPPTGLAPPHRLLAVTALVSVVLVVAVGAAMNYLRIYHLLFMQPLALLGLTLAVCALGAKLARWLPLAPSLARTLASTLLGIALIAPVFARSAPLQPICKGGASHIKEARGCSEVASAIAQDRPTGPLLVDNLTGPSGGPDSSVSVVLDLLVRGVDPTRFHGSQEDGERTWYWLVDRFEITDDRGQQVDFAALAARVEGVDVLLELQDSGELVLAVRTEPARHAFAHELCAVLPSDLRLWGRTYYTWISQLLRPEGDDTQYPEPYAECLSERVQR